MSPEKIKSACSGVCNGCGRRFATLVASACPDCGGSIVGDGPRVSGKLSWFGVPPLRYPGTYLLFVLLAAADLVFTFWIIWAEGSQAELNGVARAVIDHLGLPGAVAFKLALVVFVVVMCEVIGRRRDKTGRRLAEWSAAVTAIPVVVSIVQLLRAG